MATTGKGSIAEGIKKMNTDEFMRDIMNNDITNDIRNDPNLKVDPMPVLNDNNYNRNINGDRHIQMNKTGHIVLPSLPNSEMDERELEQQNIPYDNINVNDSNNHQHNNEVGIIHGNEPEIIHNDHEMVHIPMKEAGFYCKYKTIRNIIIALLLIYCVGGTSFLFYYVLFTDNICNTCGTGNSNALNSEMILSEIYNCTDVIMCL